MTRHAVDVPPESAGVRLDRFLAERLPEFSRSRLQALIKAGAVRLAGGPALDAPSRLLRGGERIEVEPPAPLPSRLEPEPLALDVLYEDDDLVAINKPPGMVVHPGAGRGTGTLVHALLHRYGSLSTVGGEQRPGIVHRLDRLTSGVMVVARNDLAHRALAAQFQARTARKLYEAVVHGAMPRAVGKIDLAIQRDRRNRLRMTTRGDSGREAHSEWRVRERWGAAPRRYDFLDVNIATGRTHQIRVHLAAVGHPVVGDRLYGAPATLAGPGALAGRRAERVLLHAAALDLRHPRTGAPLALRAPRPADFEAWLGAFREAAGAGVILSES